MWNEDDRKWLYEQMKKAGVDTGSYNEFKTSLNNKEDRDWYYQKSRSMGLNVGSANDFTTMMVEPVQTAEHEKGTSATIRPAQVTVQTGQTTQASSRTNSLAQDLKDTQPTVNIPTIQELMDSHKWKPRPMLESEPYLTEDGKKAYRAKRTPGMDSEGRMATEGVYTDLFTGETYDASRPETKKIVEEDAKRLPAPGYIDVRAANRQQVDELSKEIDDALLDAKGQSIGQAAHRTKDAANKGFLASMQESMLSTAGAADPNDIIRKASDYRNKADGVPTQEAMVLNKRIKDLEAAQRTMRNAKRIIAEADHNAKAGTFGKWIESSFVGGAARGFGQKLFDADNWDMGVSDGEDAISLFSALDAFDKGEKLTESQQALLDAKSVELATNAYFGSYVGKGYKAGQMTAESLPFMIEMCLNPASAAGTSAQAMLTRYALKRFGKKVVKDNAKKYLAAKVATRVAGDLAGSAAMSATTGMAGVTGDAISRMNGNVLYDTDDEGRSVFAGHTEGDDFGAAFRKAFAASTIENYSEMVGEYFKPVLEPVKGVVGKGLSKVATSKAGEKIGLKRAKEFVENVTSNDFAQLVADFEKHSKWSGTISEYAEEVAGGIMNAMVVGDQTLDTDAETGVFNLDNNIDTFLGVSLLGGAISAFKSAGYRTPKYMARKEMQRDDNDAERVFGNQEKWGGIRNTIAFGSDDEVQNMLEDVKSNPKYTEAQKRAALKYAGSVMKYRGMLDAEKKRRTEGYIDPIQNDAETSYDNGYSLETEKEKQDARNMYEYRRKQLLELTNEQSVADIDADPLGEIIRIAKDANWTPEERQVALDYVNAKATFDGMIERVRDDIDSQIAASDAMIDGRVNKTDGMIHPATMKVGYRKVYVLSGNINMNEDGTGIDLSKSDESIIIRDAETGNLEFADPRSVLSLDEAMDAAKVKEEAQQNIRMTVAQKAADVIEGTLMFKPGEVYNVIDDGGAAHTITVVPVETAEGEVAPDEGIVTVSMDGAEPVQMDKADVQRMADNANLARLQQFEQQRTIERQQKAAQEAQEQYEAQRPVYNLNDEITIRDDAGNLVRGSVTAEENEDGQIEVYTEFPVNGQKINLFTRDQLDAMVEEQNGVLVEPVTVQNYVENVPVTTENVPAAEETVAVEPMPMVGQGEDAERRGGGKTPVERKSDLAQAAVTAPLSEEVNEFDKPFVISSNGTTIFGEVGADSGLTAAPIKLSVGENVKDDNGANHGYGLLHIEAGHGAQIRAAGFSSVEDFVEAVASNYDTIREGGIIAGNQTYLLEISDEHNNTLFIQLSRDGSYWNVNSAGIFKKKYSRRKPEVYTRPALEPDTDTDTSGVDSGQSEGVTTPAGNSPQTSDGKDSENPASSQAKGEKIAENQSQGDVQAALAAAEAETAYEKKETYEPANSRMDVESNLEGKSDDTATRQDSDVSGGKVTNNSASDQENGVKSYKISAFEYTTKRGKKLNMQLVTFESELSKEQMNAAKKLAKDLKGWWSKDDGGFLMRDAESAQQLAESVLGDEGAVADAQPVTLEDMKLVTAEPASEEEEGFHGGDTVWSKQHGENKHILMAHHAHGAVQSYTFTDGTKAMAQDVEAAHEEPTPSADATGTVDDEKKGSGNKIVTDERYEQLKARMRKKLGQLNVSIIGIDPEMLAIGTEMAVYHIEKGARQFIPYAKAMIEDLGDAIRPYLKSFYNGARDLPEIEANGWTDEMTPYDEVRKIDVANFDQNTTNSMATADMVVKEEHAAQQAESAKEQIIETRNNNRNEAEQQTETNTQAVADEAAAVAGETESVVSSGDAAAISEQVSKIDEQLEKVNKQLALLGYYEADTEDPSKFHESYGYMKTAEKKAVADALTFSRRLCKALGMTAIPKREVQANIAPIGGDVTFRIPLSDGKSLYFNIGLDNDHGNLSLSRIMYRVEEKQDGAKYWNSVGHTNNYLPNDVTVDDAINDVKRMLRYDAPEFEIKEVPASTSAKQSKTTENKPKSKKKAVSLQQEQQLDLFGDLFSDLNEQTSETSNSNNNETTDVQSRTSEEGRGGYQPQQDAQVGRSTGHEAEGPDGQGMGGRSSSNTLSDGERSLGVSGIHQSKQHVEPAADATGTVATENEGKTSGNVAKNTNNNHAERGKDYAPKGVDARIEANIKAIELMQQLMMEGKQATPAQMKVLRQYSGWGGLGKAFNEHPNGRYSTNPITNRLKELLGDEAFRLAEDSKDSAFYTPAVVIDAMWDIARALGFKGGTVLEGSAGIGNIIGAMPSDMSKRSDIHAVEIDETTGNILSLLYPDAKVDIQGFEQTKIANGSVDLAITNVPFVTGLNVRDESGDLDLSKKFKDIHDFCIAKNVRKLREGGIGIFITSSGTLDNSQKLRNWLVGEGGADVVGAFRLHNKTFGGAKVTSDIIVVRKRVNGQKSAHAIDVSTVTAERTGTFADEKQRGKERTVSMDYNKYFMEHPECMAGEMFFGYEKGDTYRPSSKSLYPVNGKDQETMLAEWLKGFEGMKDEAQRKTAGNGGSGTEKQQDTVYESLGADVKEGSLILDKEGKLCVAQYGKAVPLSVNANKVKGHTKAECFQSYQAIKSALADVLAYQTENEGDEGLKPLLDKLNKAYDGFVKTYGHLHKNTSISFLKNDVDFPNILALEKYSEEGDKKGNKVERFEKTDIFKQRVVEKDKAPEPKNVKDGIIASIYQYGRIDVPYIAEKLGKNVDDVKKEIVSSGLGFENPNTLQMEVSYEYLSGNVREKLRQAEEANEGGKYAANIEALRKVIPMDIPAHLIDFTLGSSWVEPKLYEDYIKERTDVDAQLTNVGGTWYMKVPYYVQHEKNKAMGVRGEVVKKLILGSELIEAALQNKTITVSETHSVGYGSSKTTETITDKEATQACAAKIDEIRADFKEWARQKMQSDPEMSARIEKAYNEQFNNYVPLDVSMEFVPEYFSGASHKFKMRPHQAKAIVRGTMQPLMLAHEVGTGKTFTLISTAMEMRRLGTAKKPMIVVQNATVGQFVESAKTLYPNAKVLTLDDKDHTSEGRKNFYAKIKYNDWDMVVVPQSVFERIPDSEERQMRFIQDKIDEKIAILEQMREADEGGKSSIVRQAEREIEQLKDQLGAIGETATAKRKQRDSKREHITRQNTEVKAREMLDRETDDVENFDDMGIDALLVDEAHEYKHLGFATAMQRGVKGIDPSYSKKSQGVYLKTQAVLEKNNGRNVIFATGTPISNTAAEIWTFMRYLMPADTMKEYGIYYFDDFVRNFGNLTQMLEFTTNGKFKENNRFAGYVNLPELVRIWSSVADTVRTDEAQAVKDNVPDIEGGQAQDIYLPQTRALRSIMKFVKEELEIFERMSGKEKKKNSHIPLTMYGIAKAAAVDARLVMADAEDDPDSKTNEAVRQTLRSLKETAKYKGTVALFADNYQNKHSGFNLYDDIREKLIAQGVPADEVVVIRSGMTVKKKQEIFDKVNRGEIRVILGSTFTLGTGVNIQERLHTLIHLDAPNRPMDYTQRNGRIVRQGNLHKDMGIPVRVLRFGVQDSLDVTAYQRLKTKGAIADSIMKGKSMMQNSMEDRAMEEDEDVFGDTVAQLSGSQYAMLKNQAEREVRKYESKRKQWQADQTYVHNAIPRISSQIYAAEQKASENNAILAKLDESFGSTGKPAIKVGKHTFADIPAMADFFTEQNKKVKETEDEIRKSAGEEQRTRTVDVQIGNVTFTIKTTQKKELTYHGGTVDTRVSRSITISCPELGIEDMKGGAYFKNAMESIFNDIVSGSSFREDAAYNATRAERLKGELELVKSREGQPFQYDKELEDARQKLEEYTDLMKKEMEEKEKKYAEMDSDIEAATGITVNNDEEEEDETLYRIVEDESPVYDSSMSEMTSRVNGLASYKSAGYSKSQYDSYVEREKRRMRQHAEHTASLLGIEGRVTIMETPEGLKGRKTNAKGWFDPKTGKIVIILSNHRSASDVVKTVLHEGVAHYGLRALFGENFNQFLDNVFQHAEPLVRQHIVDLAKKHGWDFRTATEEYLAGLAEDANFENAFNNGWWSRIKSLFLDMLRKIGLADYAGPSLSDNELRYILWRSYENLAEPGRYRNPFREAKDISKQMELKVGDFDRERARIHSLGKIDSSRRVLENAIASEDRGPLFRDGDPEERDRTDARYLYEQRVKSGMYQTREAMLDSMLGLHEAMKAIYGKDVHIEDIADFENAYLGENRLSSMNQDEWDCFEHLLIKPLLKEVSKLEKDGSSREEVTRYMMAKHGLERNEVMARRAAEQTAMDELGKDLRAAERAVQNDPLDQDALDALDDVKQRMQDRIDALYNENRERDYGGITGLMEEDDLGIAEGLARQLVEDFENNHDVNELWAKVNDVSKAILSKQYECGMMNKDTYDDISSMYEFYIPLRGFNEKTSEEAYAYLTNKNSAFNAPIKKAHGRKSVADDPIVSLQTMAQSSILMGNRNKLVKQRFLNFVLNHPSDLASVSDLWIKYDDVKDEWTAVFPDNIEEDDSADVVEQKMRDFEEKMQQLEAADPGHYKRGKDAVNIPYRVVGDANLRQHQVLVKRNGRDYVITINGNPRAAQALNGLTNPDNRMSGSFGSIINTVGAINRTLSALYTTMSIDFVAGNFLRDTLYANTMVWIKESPRYARRYNKNYVKTKRVMQLLGKYRKGTLDMNNETEKMFYQFMKNGGETGYMRMADIDEHRKQIKKALKAMNEKIPARMVRELVTTWIAEVGRGIEMRARFAAFITSREMGRTIGLSIWDAKEITVNFNKKGAGDKFIGATGQTFMGNTAAFVSGAGRATQLFWNAALQGTFGNFGKYAMRHKGKAATAVSMFFALGLLISSLAAASGDDDDDSYFDQPEHIRRQNIVFKLFGKTWGKIPLPIEYRAVYGLGELAGCVIFNHEKLEYDKLAKQLSQVLPVDLLEGFDALLYPSAVKPAVEAANNESWYGTPIWKDTPFNKHMPEWTKSYKSTDQRLVALSETLNEMSGGSKYKKGAIDINPAKMEYLLKQYSGGLFTLANQLGSMYDVATGDKEFDWRYAPMLNRMFMTGGDERNVDRGLNEKFFRYMEAYDAKASEFSAIKNDLTLPLEKKAELIAEIVSDPEYMKMKATKNMYSKMNQAYKMAMEVGNTEQAEKLMKEMNALKRKFIDEMEDDDEK